MICARPLSPRPSRAAPPAWRRLGQLGARWAEGAGLLAFPPRCLACQEPLAQRPCLGLCGPCGGALWPNAGPRCPACDHPEPPAAPCGGCTARPLGLGRIRAPWAYRGALVPMVRGLKEGGRPEAAAALGRLVAGDEEARQLAAGASALVPVPMPWRRRLARGGNHAAALARALGAQLGLPVRHLLVARGARPRQATSRRPARQANLAGAFVPQGAATGHLVLVDDVITTGQTLAAAAAALRAAGAERVDGLAAGRTWLAPHPGGLR